MAEDLMRANLLIV